MSLTITREKVALFKIGGNCIGKRHGCQIVLRNGESKTVHLSDGKIAALVKGLQENTIVGKSEWEKYHITTKGKSPDFMETPASVEDIFSSIFGTMNLDRIADAIGNAFNTDEHYSEICQSIFEHHRKGILLNPEDYLKNWTIKEGVEGKVFNFYKKLLWQD